VEQQFTEFAAPRLRRTAFLLCGDWHTAEDLAQIALAEVFVSWRRISQRDAAQAYATGTLGNRYLAGRRRKRATEMLLGGFPTARALDKLRALLGDIEAEAGRTRMPCRRGGARHATATNVPGKPIEVGGNPAALAITPDARTVYAASFLRGTVTPIATATNTPGKPIKVGPKPWLFAIAR